MPGLPNKVNSKRCSIYFNQRCNARCVFCYFLNQVKSPNADESYDVVKNRIRIAKEYYDLEWLDVSGGEATLYPHIDDAVAFSNDIGIGLCLITNGIYTNKIKQLIDVGLRDILLSIEGVGEIHNRLIAVPSAFSQMMKTLEVLKKKGFSFRVNTVVTAWNHKHLVELYKFLDDYPVSMVNLIPFNPHSGVQWTNTDNVLFQSRYSDIVGGIKDAVSYLSGKKIWVNIRYLPFCIGRGLEKHICNFRQNVYSMFDWVGFFEWGHTHEQIVNLSMVKDDSVYGEIGSYERACNVAVDGLLRNNKKLQSCRQCRNYLICDGLYQQYLRNFDSKEFIPVIGEKVVNPNYYRTDDEAKIYKKLQRR